MNKPRESTVRRLYAPSMNVCAFPDCQTQLVTIDTRTVIGEVCHIHAQNVGGPRYLASQTDEDRHGFDNLVLMCRNCHKVIDAVENVAKYSDEWLREVKRSHEDRARRSGEIPTPPDVITALSWTVAVYQAGATHMDFRNAVFKVGGEGGTLAGPGGQGGTLTIVGIASLPSDIEREMRIDLAGGPGQYPGSGGGGAGALAFEGRPATADDVAAGLTVPLFFPVNAGQLADGLLHILGAGWDHIWVTEVPCRATISVAYTADFGPIAANTLLRFEFAVSNESGAECGRGAGNVVVPDPQGAINRNSGVAMVGFDIAAPGIYELSILSGSTRFSRYTFEVRRR